MYNSLAVFKLFNGRSVFYQKSNEGAFILQESSRMEEKALFRV